MNLSVEYQPPKAPILKGSEEKPVYILGVAWLLVFWAILIAVTVSAVVAAFVPGHSGLTDWLRILGDSPISST
jgi:hypothetical protein